MKRRIILKIKGAVQGVTMRAQIERFCDKVKLAGFVRNERDGSVMVAAEGEEKNLQELLGFCYNGVQGARVDSIDVSWESFKGEFKEFEIFYL